MLAGDIIGRFFNEFAMTFSVAILISLVISLTTAPMLCAMILNPLSERRPGRLSVAFDHGYQVMLRFYDHTLLSAMRHSWATLPVFFVTIGLNVYLFIIAPKGLLPQQDVGRIFGFFEMEPMRLST